MSVQAIVWAMRQELADPTTKLTLVVLADHASESEPADEPGADGRFMTWVGVKTVARVVGIKDRALQYQLKILEDLGLIKRVARVRANGGNTSNFTILAMDEDGPRPFAPDDISGMQPVAREGRQPVAPQCEPSVMTRQVEPEKPQPSATASPTPIEAKIVDAEIVDDAACPPPPPVQENAGTMLAKWIDYCRARGVQMTPTTVKRYGAKFKELLDAGFEPHLIGLALQAMCQDNVISKVNLIDHYVTRAQTGPEKRPRDVRTNQEVRNEQVTELIRQAEELVKIRGERRTNRAVSAAMKEIRQGVVNVGAMLAGGRRELTA